MSVGSIAGQSSLAIQSLVQMRAQLNDLQRQISTGQKSDSYAGLGSGRGMTVSLNAQLANLASYNDTIDNVGTRVSLAQTALGRIADIGSTTKSSLHQSSYASNTSGQLATQATALSSLDELLGLLNTRAGDRYIFSGRATTQPAVDTLDHILNGNGAQAGLKQLISERSQADLGDGHGRLTITAPSATSVSLAEDSASPFGLKLASASTTMSGATVTGPGGGPPAAMSVDLGSTNPNEGDTLTVRFTLPDGTSENVTLTATNTSPPGANQFSIGTTPAATSTNLQNALTGAIGTLAATSLMAASAIATTNNFFDADSTNPPQRVVGPSFDTATALTSGTNTNTVIWYTGETGTGPARSSATARIDPTLTVSYGTRANEDGIRSILKSVAALAAASYSPSDPNATAKSTALNQRLSANLNGSDGVQSVVAIQAQLAGVQTSLSSAKARHAQTSATLGDFLQQISGVSNEEVGASILTLQTRLQASMQTTALLYQTSLVNYLK